EKEDGSGNVCYDAANHEKMTHLRADKVARIANDLDPLEVHGEQEGELLILGWGSTLGAITGAVNVARDAGIKVSRTHLRHLNPLPSDLGDVLARLRHVLVPEMNMGQLALLLRAKYLVDIVSFTKIQGKPFYRQEISDKIDEILESANHGS
ncbi:MAG: 2-oxoglutarate ferredoxin oxidoreductase subunit alpha, partial [Thermoanaerobaculia bacterium]